MGITSKPKSTSESVPNSRKKHLDLVKKEKVESPLEYFRDFVGKKITINRRRYVIESLEGDLGVKVSLMNGKEKLEEILKDEAQWKQLRGLIERSTKRNLENKETEDASDNIPEKIIEKPASKNPRLELVVNDEKIQPENQGDSNREIEELKNDAAQSVGGEIDLEKRKEGNREIWEEKVQGTKTIAELCDVVDEIGLTKVDGKIIHPDVIRFRLKTFEFFSDEEINLKELKTITPEFGIRDKAEEIMNREIKTIKLEPKDIEELKKDLDEAKEAYEARLGKIKELKSFFGRSLPSLSPENDPELVNLKGLYEKKKEENEKALGKSDANEEYLKKAA